MCREAWTLNSHRQYYLLPKLSVRSRESLSGSAISLYKSPQQERECFNWEAKVPSPFQTPAPNTRMPTLHQPAQLIFSCRAFKHWTHNSPLTKPHNTLKTSFWFSLVCNTVQCLNKNTQKQIELPKHQRSTLTLWSPTLLVPRRSPKKCNRAAETAHYRPPFIHRAQLIRKWLL